MNMLLITGKILINAEMAPVHVGRVRAPVPPAAGGDLQPGRRCAGRWEAWAWGAGPVGPPRPVTPCSTASSPASETAVTQLHLVSDVHISKLI